MNPLMGEAEVSIDGEVYQLVLDNAALVVVEDLIGGPSYLDAVLELVRAEMVEQTPRLKTTGAFLFAAMRRKHPGVTLDECYSLIRQRPLEVMPPLGKAIRGVVKLEDDEPGEAQPVVTPAKQNDGTGEARSKPITKQGAKPRRSGAKRP